METLSTIVQALCVYNSTSNRLAKYCNTSKHCETRLDGYHEMVVANHKHMQQSHGVETGERFTELGGCLLFLVRSFQLVFIY